MARLVAAAILLALQVWLADASGSDGGGDTNNSSDELHFYGNAGLGLEVSPEQRGVSFPFPVSAPLALRWNATVRGQNGAVALGGVVPFGSRIVPALALRKQMGMMPASNGTSIPAFYIDESVVIKLSEGVVVTATSGESTGVVTFQVPPTVRTGRTTQGQSITYYLGLVVVPPGANNQPSDATEQLRGISMYPAFVKPVTFSGGRTEDTATADFPRITLMSIAAGPSSTGGGVASNTAIRAGSDALVSMKVAAPAQGKPSYDPGTTRFCLFLNLADPRNPSSDRLLFNANFIGNQGFDSFSSSRDTNGDPISLPAVGGSDTNFFRQISVPSRDALLKYDLDGALLSLVVVSGPGAGLAFNLGSPFPLKGFLNLQAPGSVSDAAAGGDVSLSFTTAFASNIILGTGAATQSVQLAFSGLSNPSSSMVKFAAFEINPSTGAPFPGLELEAPEALSATTRSIALPQTLPTSDSSPQQPPNDTEARKYLLCAMITSNAGSFTPAGEPFDAASRRLFPGAYTCVLSSLSAGGHYSTFSTLATFTMKHPTNPDSPIVAGQNVKFTWTLSSPLQGFNVNSKVRIAVFDINDAMDKAPRLIGVAVENVAITAGTATGILPAFIVRSRSNSTRLNAYLQVTTGPGVGYGISSFEVNNGSLTYPSVTASLVQTPSISIGQPSSSSVWRLGDQSVPVRWSIPAVPTDKRSAFTEDTTVDLHLVPLSNGQQSIRIMQLPLGARVDGMASSFNANISIPNNVVTGLDSSMTSKGWKLELRIQTSGADELTDPVFVQSPAFTLMAGPSNNKNNNTNNNNGGEGGTTVNGGSTTDSNGGVSNPDPSTFANGQGPSPLPLASTSNAGPLRPAFSTAIPPFLAAGSQMTISWKIVSSSSTDGSTPMQPPPTSFLQVFMLTSQPRKDYNGYMLSPSQLIPNEDGVIWPLGSSLFATKGMSSGSFQMVLPATMATKLSSGDSDGWDYYFGLFLVDNVPSGASSSFSASVYSSPYCLSAIRVTAGSTPQDSKGFPALSAINFAPAVDSDGTIVRSGREAKVTWSLGSVFTSLYDPQRTRVRVWMRKMSGADYRKDLVPGGYSQAPQDTLVALYPNWASTQSSDAIGTQSKAVVLVPRDARYSSFSFAYDQFDWKIFVQIISGPGVGLVFASASTFEVKGYLWMNNAGSGGQMLAWSSDSARLLPPVIVIPETANAASVDDAFTMTLGFKLNGATSDVANSKARIVAIPVPAPPSNYNPRPLPPVFTFTKDVTVEKDGTDNTVDISVPMTLFTSVFDNSTIGLDYFFAVHITSGPAAAAKFDYPDDPLLAYDRNALASSLLFPNGTYIAQKVRVRGGSRTNGYDNSKPTGINVVPVDSNALTAGKNARITWTLPEALGKLSANNTMVAVTAHSVFNQGQRIPLFGRGLTLMDAAAVPLGQRSFTFLLPAWALVPDPGQPAGGPIRIGLRFEVVAGPGLGLAFNTETYGNNGGNTPVSGFFDIVPAPVDESIVIRARLHPSQNGVLQTAALNRLILSVPAVANDKRSAFSPNSYGRLVLRHTRQSSFMNEIWSSNGWASEDGSAVETTVSVFISPQPSELLDLSASTQSWNLDFVVRRGRDNALSTDYNRPATTSPVSIIRGPNDKNGGGGSDGQGQNQCPMMLESWRSFYACTKVISSKGFGGEEVTFPDEFLAASLNRVFRPNETVSVSFTASGVGLYTRFALAFALVETFPGSTCSPRSDPIFFPDATASYAVAPTDNVEGLTRTLTARIPLNIQTSQLYLGVFIVEGKGSGASGGADGAFAAFPAWVSVSLNGSSSSGVSVTLPPSLNPSIQSDPSTGAPAAIAAGQSFQLKWKTSGGADSSSVFSVLLAPLDGSTGKPRDEAILTLADNVRANPLGSDQGNATVTIPDILPGGPSNMYVLAVMITGGKGSGIGEGTASDGGGNGGNGGNAYAAAVLTLTTTTSGKPGPPNSALTLTKPAQNDALIVGSTYSLSWTAPRSSLSLNYASSFAQITLSRAPNQTVTVTSPSGVTETKSLCPFFVPLVNGSVVVGAPRLAESDSANYGTITRSVSIPADLPIDGGDWYLQIMIVNGVGVGTFSSVKVKLVGSFNASTQQWVPLNSRPGSLGSSKDGSKQVQLISPAQQGTVNAGADFGFVWRAMGISESPLTKFTLAVTPYDDKKQLVAEKRVVIAADVSAKLELDAATQLPRAKRLLVPTEAVNGFSQLSLTWQGQPESDPIISIVNVTITGGENGLPYLKALPLDMTVSFFPGSTIAVMWEAGGSVPTDANISIALTSASLGSGATIQFPNSKANGRYFGITVPLGVAERTGDKWKAASDYVITLSTRNPSSTSNPPVMLTATITNIKIHDLPKITTIPLTCKADNTNDCQALVTGDAKSNGQMKVKAVFTKLPPNFGMVLALCHNEPTFPVSPSSSQEILRRVGLFAAADVATPSATTSVERCFLLKQLSPRGGTESADVTVLESVKIPASASAKTGWFAVAAIMPLASMPSIVLPAGANLDAQLTAEATAAYPRVRASASFEITGSDASGASIIIPMPSAINTVSAGESMLFGIVVQGLDPALSSSAVKLEIWELPLRTLATTISASYRINQGVCVASALICSIQQSFVVPASLAPAAGATDRSFVLKVSSLATGGTDIQAQSVQFVVKSTIPAVFRSAVVFRSVSNNVAPFSASVGGMPALKAGESIGIAWNQTSSVRGPFTVSIIPVACSGANPITFTTTHQGTAFSTSEVFMGLIPLDYQVPQACLASTSPTFVARVTTSASGTTLEVKSPAFFILPPAGVLRVPFPAKGTRFASGSKFNVLFEGTGFVSSVKISFHLVKAGTSTNPPTLDGAYPSTLTQPAGNQLAAPLDSRIVSAALTLAEGKAEALVVAKVEQDQANGIVAWSEPFVVFSPPSKFTAAVLKSTADNRATGSSPQPSFTTGEEVAISWTYQGFPASARVIIAIGLNPLSPKSQAVITPPEGIVVTQGQFKFRLPSTLSILPASQSLYFMAVGILGQDSCDMASGNLIVSSTFTLTEPTTERLFVRAVADPDAVTATANTNSTSALAAAATGAGCAGLMAVITPVPVFSLGGQMKVTWASTSDLASASVRIELRNRADPSFVQLLKTSLTFSNVAHRAVDLDLTAGIDTSASRAPFYYVRVVHSSREDLFAESLAFSLRQPFGRIAVTKLTIPPSTTTSATTFVASTSSAPSSITVFFTSTGIPSALNGVKLLLRNRFAAGVNFELSADMAASADEGASGITLPLPTSSQLIAAGVTSSAVASAFVIRVVSTSFPAVSGESSQFEITTSAAVERHICITMIGDASGCIPPSYTSGWATPADNETPTINWRGSGFAGGDLVILTVKNALVPSVNRALCAIGTNCQTYSSGGFTVSSYNSGLSGLFAAVSSVPGAKDAFTLVVDVHAAGTTTPTATTLLKSIFTPFFTIRSSAATALGMIKLLHPIVGFAAAAGSSFAIRYQSAGLAPTDTITAELVNNVLRPPQTITLATGLPQRSDTDTTLVVPEAARPALGSSASAANAWRVKLSAGASAFDLTPYFSVLNPGLRVTRPSGGAVGKIGENLEIAFEAFGISGNVEVHLLNELTSDSTTVVELLPLATEGPTTLSFVLPDTISTKSSVATGYYLRVRSLADSSVMARSGGFTVRGSDKALSIISPNPGAIFSLGQQFRVQLAGNGLRGPVRAVLANAATGRRVELMAQPGVAAVDASSANPTISYLLPLDFPTTPFSADKWILQADTESSAASPARIGPLTIKPLEVPVTVDLQVPPTGLKLGGNLEFSFSLSPDASSSSDFSSLTITLRNRQALSFSRVLSSALPPSDAGSVKSFLMPQGLQVGGAVGSAYFVRVGSATNNILFGDSDPFTLTKKDASLSFTSFLSGTVIFKGDTLRISWAASGVDPDASVKISITNSKTLFRATVAEVSVTSADTTGLTASSLLTESMVLALPKDLPIPSSDKRGWFTVEVALSSDATVFAASEAFTILPPRQAVKVVSPNSASGQPIFAAAAGTKIPLEFLGRSIGGAQVRIQLRNASIPASRLSSISNDDLEDVATVLTIGSSLAADMAAYQSEPVVFRVRRCPTERTNAIVGLSLDAADQVTCGAFTVTLTQAIEDALSTASAYGSANPFVLRVSLVEDDSVVSESSPFFFRQTLSGLTPPVLTSPALDDTYTAGDSVVVKWTNGSVSGSIGTASVKVSLGCSASSATAPVEVVALDPMSLSAAHTAATSASGMTLRIPLLALGDMPIAKNCFVLIKGQATTSRPQDGAIQLLSARFTMKRAPLAISFVAPSPLTASSVAVAAGTPSTLVKLLSGADFAASWAFSLGSSAINPLSPPTELSFASLEVSMVRLGTGGAADVPAATFSLAPPASTGALSTAIASGQVVPPTAPFGIYYLQVSAVPQGWRGDKVVAQSAPFLVTPAERSIKIDEAPTTLAVGRLLQIVFTPTAIAGTNSIRVTIRPQGAAVDAGSVVVLAAKIPASGIFKAPLPSSLTAGNYVVRLSVIEDPDIAVDTAAIAVTVPAALITVTFPTLRANRELPVWSAGDLVSVSFTAIGFPSDATFNVTLEQDRFLLGSADRTVSIIAEGQSITSGNATVEWSVPSDLNSTVNTYVRVALVTTDARKPWARSVPIVLRSKPVPGLKEWLTTLCANNGASLPSSMRALCKDTCSTCAANNGYWLGAVSLALEPEFVWPGSAEGKAAIKNALGAFAAQGLNLCWPRAALVSSTGNSTTGRSTAGTYRLSLDGLANAAIADLTAGNLAEAAVVLTVSSAFNPVATTAACDNMPPRVTAKTTLVGVSASQFTPADLSAFIDFVAQKTGTSPGDIQAVVVPSEVVTSPPSLTISMTVTASDDNTALSIQETLSNLPGFTLGARRLSLAAAAAPAPASRALTAVTVQGSATAYTSESQSSVDSAVSSTETLYPLTVDSGSANRPAGGDDASSDLSGDAYSSGEYAKQKQIAAARDTGKAAVTSPGGGGGGGGGGSDAAPSANIGAIVGGVVGGLVVIAIVVGLTIYTVKGRTTRGIVVVSAAPGSTSGNPVDAASFGNQSNVAVSPLAGAGMISPDSGTAKQRAQQLQYAQTQVSSRAAMLASPQGQQGQHGFYGQPGIHNNGVGQQQQLPYSKDSVDGPGYRV